MLGISDDEKLTLLPSKTQPVYKNRAGWAHDRLKRSGLSSSPRRGYWKLTDKGIDYARSHESPLTEEEIKNITIVDPRIRLRPQTSDDGDQELHPLETEIVREAHSTPDDRLETAITELREATAEDLLETIAVSQSAFKDVAHFEGAIFSEAAYFAYASFSGELNFRDVIFRHYVKFAGTENRQAFSDTSSLDLQFARIEEPEHLSFHTLIMRPQWFVNVDARQFEFVNVDWRINFKQAIRDLRKSDRRVQRLLAIAYRNLAVNAEENHRYEEASKLRYLAMDARRLESLGGFAPWRLSWWYWLARGYGERVLKGFFVLLGIWFVLGPVQAALLALAIRCKFMR